MIFSEAKLDASYPADQFIIEGFSNPFRLDINSNGGGLLIYVREDIPCNDVYIIIHFQIVLKECLLN